MKKKKNHELKVALVVSLFPEQINKTSYTAAPLLTYLVSKM